MQEFLLVGAGGFIGSCARHGLTRLLSGLNAPLPYGTLLANVLAGLLIGLLAGTESGMLSDRARLFLVTGMLGGLSTFSAFSLETVNLFRAGSHLMATANILLNLGLSGAGVLLGIGLIKQLS